MAQVSGKLQDKRTHVNSARFPKEIHPLFVCLRMILLFPSWISCLAHLYPHQAPVWAPSKLWKIIFLSKPRREQSNLWTLITAISDFADWIPMLRFFQRVFQTPNGSQGSPPYSANALIIHSEFARVRVFGINGITKIQRRRSLRNKHFFVARQNANLFAVRFSRNNQYPRSTPRPPDRSGSKSFGEASGTT